MATSDIEKAHAAIQRSLERVEKERDDALEREQELKLELDDKRSEIKALEKKQENLKSKKMTTRGRVIVDLGGGMMAQVGTEFINWLLRYAADWSKDGFFANYADFLQSAPHTIGGAIWYAAEMAGSKNGELPGAWKQARIEAAKLFMNLGMANLARAVRTRYADSKEKLTTQGAQVAALAQQNSGLQKELAELRERLKQIQGVKVG